MLADRRSSLLTSGIHAFPYGRAPNGDFKRAGGFKGLRRLIARKGGDPSAILNCFGINPALLDDSETYLPYARMIGVLEHCADLLAEPFFGFELGQWQSIDAMGPLAILLLASETVKEGLALVAYYISVHAPGARLYLKEADGEARLSYSVLNLATTFSRQVNELSMVLALQILRVIAGPGFRLTGVEIASAPPPCDAERLERFFGAPFAYDRPRSMLHFPAKYLRQRIDTSNPLLLGLIRMQCDALLPQDDDLRSRVASQVRQFLPMGGSSLRVIARQFSLHPRSLQNHLSDEGLEFRAIVKAERRALAEAYLSDTRMPIAEVASLLGYADQAGFTRAFSSWVGTSPKRFRDMHKPAKIDR